MKGFLSSALVLAMLLCLLWISAAANQNTFLIEQTKNELIKAETANKERTLLENSVDKIVITKLNEQITLQNFNVQKAQNEINEALQTYLKEKAHTANLTHKKTGEITKQFLNENTSVAILRGEEVIFAEYTYTSTIFKNTIISAKLGNKIISYFEVPIGYTHIELRVI